MKKKKLKELKTEELLLLQDKYYKNLLKVFASFGMLLASALLLSLIPLEIMTTICLISVATGGILVGSILVNNIINYSNAIEVLEKRNLSSKDIEYKTRLLRVNKELEKNLSENIEPIPTNNDANNVLPEIIDNNVESKTNHNTPKAR